MSRMSAADGRSSGCWPAARPPPSIAQSTGYNRGWIGQIARRFNAQGSAGVVKRQRTTSWRAPRMLSAQQQEELRAAHEASVRSM